MPRLQPLIKVTAVNTPSPEVGMDLLIQRGLLPGLPGATRRCRHTSLLTSDAAGTALLCRREVHVGRS